MQKTTRMNKDLQFEIVCNVEGLFLKESNRLKDELARLKIGETIYRNAINPELETAINIVKTQRGSWINTVTHFDIVVYLPENVSISYVEPNDAGLPSPGWTKRPDIDISKIDNSEYLPVVYDLAQAVILTETELQKVKDALFTMLANVTNVNQLCALWPGAHQFLPKHAQPTSKKVKWPKDRPKPEPFSDEIACIIIKRLLTC